MLKLHERQKFKEKQQRKKISLWKGMNVCDGRDMRFKIRKK